MRRNRKYSCHVLLDKSGVWGVGNGDGSFSIILYRHKKIRSPGTKTIELIVRRDEDVMLLMVEGFFLFTRSAPTKI
jgi:hypothetical protein